MKLTFIKALSPALLCSLLLVVTVFGQGGSGDLPPVPKATGTKTKAKPTPTKTKSPAKTGAPTTSKVVAYKEPAKVEPIPFDQSVEGKIDAQTAGRIPPNVFFQEFTLQGTDADLFKIQLYSQQASLKVELLDGNKISLPLKRDEHSGEYLLATPEATLPTDGEYHVRVSIAPSPTLAAPVLFTLKVNHLGLTAAGYKNRLEQIVKGFNMQKLDEAIQQLERLAQDDPKQAGAYEYLGLVYNEFKRDQVKASAAMLQAIKLGGSAIFKIARDSQWRKPSRDRQTQRMVFQDLRTSWVKISSSQLIISDFETPDKPILTITQAQLKEASRLAPTSVVVIKHTNKLIKPDTINIALPTPIEADQVLDVIKGNLLGKG